MFKNYFKTAWRNIIKSKGYRALNILGLATGMSVALLIGLWVYNEYSYNKFLPHYQQLYQVRRNFNSNVEILTFSTTSLKLADALRNQIPEMEYVAKVLGATVSQVWLLLSKDFILLVMISCVIASPVALYFLQYWLQKYAYSTNIGAGVFILAAAMAMVITLVTISFQAIKAAIANPVKSLRTE